MKKVFTIVLAAVLLFAAVSCGPNPNKSPTDKVGGYHTSKVAIEKTIA